MVSRELGFALGWPSGVFTYPFLHFCVIIFVIFIFRYVIKSIKLCVLSLPDRLGFCGRLLTIIGIRRQPAHIDISKYRWLCLDMLRGQPGDPPSVSKSLRIRNSLKTVESCWRMVFGFSNGKPGRILSQITVSWSAIMLAVRWILLWSSMVMRNSWW